ncbi:gliding motility-associated C-terminal domain-containing protein, partial [Salinimicrobium catena]|uniref:gliding motility-associated C-terminal domain-containing protein n=1 Tax=Salinimicrobium catena TaxID=390640 RepID=UPI00089108BC
ITGNQTLTCDVTSVTLDASASTADGNFTYLWSDGSTDPTITVTQPNTYFVIITGENGCSAETSVTVEAFQESPAAPELSGTPVQPTCTEPTGSFEIIATEGLTYSINGGEFTTATGFSNLAPDTYSVVAKNEYGCTSQPLNVSIEAQPDAPAAPIIHVTVHPSCGETTGSFGICCDNGLEYSIDGENFQRDPIFMDLAPGYYEVVARNAEGCLSVPTPVTINEAPETPAAPEVASVVQPTCEVPTGSFTVTTETGLEYSIDGTTWQTEGTFEDLTAETVYEVVARNPDGCISEATQVTIDAQPETPAAPAVASVVQPTCEVPTGSFTVTTETGLEYSIDGTTWQTDGSFEDLTADTVYEVVARNADGCISEATQVTIDAQPNTPAAPAIASVEQPSCEVPSGFFTVTTETGLEYSIDGTNWQTDGSFEDLTADAIYEVVARNSEGCISEATQVSIEAQPETPAAPAVASTVQPSCEDPSGSFTVTTETGLEYSINGTDFYTSGEFNDLAPDSYEVIARNTDGCISAATTVTINPQPETPAAPVVEDIMQPSCVEPSGMVVLTYIEGITYSLTDEAGNTTADTDEDGIFGGLAPGTYSITAENAEGCLSEGTQVSIDEQPEAPIAPEVSFTQPSCETPTGSITITAEEGMLYRINDGEISAETSFTQLSPGTYTVIAVNAEGCESQPVTVTLNQPEAAVIETADPMSLCIEDAAYNLQNMLLGEYDQSGTWEDPANTGALENGSIDPSLLALGTYTFNYVIEGTCPSTTSVEISINDDCVVLACELEDVKESISKVVTPNGDGINEFFTVGLDLDCGFIYHVQIFNRWGNKVYESNNYQNNWDGTARSSFTGDQLPAGTYYYIVQIEGLEPIQGYIYLGTK